MQYTTPLAPATALALAENADPRFEELMARARDVRDARYGRQVSYSPKVFLPLTNLCRNACAYCSFRRSPTDPEAHTLDAEEVASLLDRGAEAGCTEALFCLGDRAESVSPAYRQRLSAMGHRTTTDYLERAATMALQRGILPHTNAGILTLDEMRRLREVNASLGLMLESASDRLCEPGQPHHHAPDKRPALRLGMLTDAGALRIPITTGILVGIGETMRERVEALLTIQALHERQGHIQEVIVQPFAPHPGSAMSTSPAPSTREVLLSVALARLILAPDITVQVPPNLLDEGADAGGLTNAVAAYLAAGINDWGGISPVTPDHINPGRPWPHVDGLAALCAQAGFELAPRLPVHARYLAKEGFVAPRVHEALAGMAGGRYAPSMRRTAGGAL